MLASATNAQSGARRTCGTMDNLAQRKAEDPGLEGRMLQIENMTAAYVSSHANQNTINTVITIPVVFHVVYNTAAQNISDAQCQAQLDQLNLDYARMNADAASTPSVWQSIAVNTNIQFCLAQRDPSGNATTGVEHKSTTATSFSSNDNVKRVANGGAAAWDATKYLNIWSCNLGGGLLGYAQFPGGAAATDGVVFLYSSIGSVARPGTASPYNLGRTATHEVGHWLNLYHIWGDDGTACSGTDNCGDTPNQAGENYGAPAFPHTDGCSTTSPGVMFMNYMDYTDDNAMNMFTANQSARMNALFATGGARASMLSSLGCQAPTASCGNPTGLSVSAITTSGATVSWTGVSGAVSYNVQYKLSSASTYTTLSTSATSAALSSLSSGSSYDWQVQAVCSAASGAYVASTFTTASVVTCGTASGLSSSAITTSGATLSWTAVSGATSYNVSYQAGASAATVVSSATNSITLSSLASATTYTWSVQVICSAGAGSYSAAASFTTSSTGCTDQYESNNTSGTAKTISTNTDISGLISTTSDIDYFKFSTTSPNTKIKITLGTLPFDYDIKLYNSSLSLLSTSQNSSTTSETIIRNTTTAGTYYIRIYPYSGSSATQCYTLRVNTGSANYRSSDDLSGAEAVPAMNDFTLFPNPAQNIVSVAFDSPSNDAVSVRIFDIVGKTVIASKVTVSEGSNKFSFEVSDLTKGIYFVELSNASERIVKKLILEK